MWNIITISNNWFLLEYILKCNLFLRSKLYFQHHYSSLQCHMIFRNHSNILIWSLRNIYDYYILKTVVYNFFQDSLMNIKLKHSIYLKWKSNVRFYMSLLPLLINLMQKKVYVTWREWRGSLVLTFTGMSKSEADVYSKASICVYIILRCVSTWKINRFNKEKNGTSNLCLFSNISLFPTQFIKTISIKSC